LHIHVRQDPKLQHFIRVNMEVLNPLQYPIGKFSAPEVITPAIREEWISVIEALPEQLATLLANVDESLLEKPYREGGWSARKVIHHLFDSHINSYIRFKMALTEDNPTIKPYDENTWAEMPDGNEAPIQWSIEGIKYIHLRWVYLMKTMQESDWSRTYFHPERGVTYRLDKVLGIYAWHCVHHLKHVESVL
jgi:hypothetical protein